MQTINKKCHNLKTVSEQKFTKCKEMLICLDTFMLLRVLALVTGHNRHGTHYVKSELSDEERRSTS